MNTIDTGFSPEMPLPLRRASTPDKDSRPAKTFRQEAEQAITREVITEKTVSDVAIRMDFLGLEYRRIDTVERKINSTTETKKAAQEREDTGDEAPDESPGGSVINVIGQKDGHDESSAARKIQRAYLSNNPGNKPIRYLA